MKNAEWIKQRNGDDLGDDDGDLDPPTIPPKP